MSVVKKWFLASKTVWVNVLVILAALLSFVVGPEFPIELTAQHLQILLLILALVNLALRFVTGQPITLKKK